MTGGESTQMPVRGGARSWVVVLAVALGVAVTTALGIWQLARAAEKRAQSAAVAARARQPLLAVAATPLDAATVALRRVEARGRFDPRRTVYLDNRVYHGVPGYHVITPLALGDANGRTLFVLVDRGWVAGTGDRAKLPVVPTPEGEVTITGIAVEPGEKFLELSTKTGEGNVWQNLVLERYRQATGLAVQPFVIRQENDAPDGLVRDWPAPDLGIERHYGYAFQWFALGVTLLVFFIVSHVRRRRREANDAR